MTAPPLGPDLQAAIAACPHCHPGHPCPGHALDLEAAERLADAKVDPVLGRVDEEAQR